MKVIQDNLWLCIDCTFAAVNYDFGEVDHESEKIIRMGLTRLGPGLVPNDGGEQDSGIDEFSHRICDCCGSALGGWRNRFAVLGPEEPK